VDRARYKDKRARIAMMARYAEGVREADAALGVLLAGLAEREREPLILVAADHGEFMAEPLDRIGFAYGHGVLLGPEVAWVPLVAAGPGVDAARVAGAASLTDLYTTILEASGVGDPAAELEGRVDLLGPLPDGRVVHTARRALSAKQLAKRGAHSAAIRAIAQRAVAVTDGTSLVLVGEDGKPAEPGPGAPPALVAAAQSFLVAQRVAPAPVASPPAAAGSPRR
jgi:arylsulfatase A-like enzyme